VARTAHDRSKETGPHISDALRNASDAIWIVPSNGCISYANESARQFHAESFGTSLKVGEKVEAAYPADQWDKWSDRYTRAANGERVYALETYGGGDQELYYELVLDRVETTDKCHCVSVVARPITERRRTMEGTTFEARAVISPDTYVLYANQCFRDLIGIAQGTPIKSLRLRDLLDSEDELLFARAVSDATQNSTRLDRLRILDLKGAEHETVGTIARSPDSGNLALALLDTTRQIETEQRLERHAKHLQALHAWAAELNAYMEQPEVLYERSLELLSNTVQFDTASVQLLKKDRISIVASAGFPDAQILLGVSFPFDSMFPNWHVVTSREIIAVDDVGVDYPHFHAEADHYESGHISSWLGVPLGVRDEVLGMVALDRGEVDPFTEDEQQLVATMAAHIAAAVHNSQLYSALQESEERLQEANQQKEVLLRELHHRSKNNMQMISSLLSLGAAAVSVEEDGRVLDEVRMRIQSLAAVHEELYRSDNLDSLDLADYARRVTQMIVSSYGRAGVAVGIEADEMSASIDIAVPFGLILSELVLNAYKHAFPEFAEGTIRVGLTASAEDATLVIQDDGIGMSEDQWRNPQDSLGMQLIASLVDQVNGSIDLSDVPGTKWMVRFPLGRQTE
jgi:two-component sensor histidine kinase